MLEKETIEHIAHLARLGLPEGEIAAYQKELSQVLDFFAELQKLDTASTEAVGHISGRLAVPRTDALNEASPEERAGILKNVPEKKGNAVVVHSVL